MISPREDKSWSDTGFDQILALAVVSKQTGLKPDSLTLARISHAIFDRSSDRGKAMSIALRSMARPLRRLRLSIQACSSPTSDPDAGFPSVDLEAMRCANRVSLSPEEVTSGGFSLKRKNCECSSWSSPCGTLILSATNAPARPYPEGHHVPSSLPPRTSQCAVKGEFFIDLPMRHKATLWRLSFAEIALYRTRRSW
jgi:hypothetical protein